MSNLYIHFPFCLKKCSYCNFYSTASSSHREHYSDALIEELKKRKELWNNEFDTIYFGGGTPSMLSSIELSKILESVYKHLKISRNAEITLEANPENVNNASLKEWRMNGINRLSIGTQSFNDYDLQWLGRNHGANQSLDALILAKAAGFENISADLIFGVPGSTISALIDNLKWIEELHIPHLSAYALTVESNTPLNLFIQRGQKPMPNDEFIVQSFETIMQWAPAHGLEQYEISNYAKSGFRSRHNSAYWSGNSYLGLGPGAHSFDGKSRRWNTSDIVNYVKSDGNVPFEQEELDEIMKINEYILTRIRTSDGIVFRNFQDSFGFTESKRLRRIAQPYVESGHLVLSADNLRLTQNGILIADRISSDFFR